MALCLINILHFLVASHPTCWLTAQTTECENGKQQEMLYGGFVVFVVKRLRITDEPIQAFVLICCIMWWHCVVVFYCDIVRLWFRFSRLHTGLSTKTVFLIWNLFSSCHLGVLWET